MNIALIAELLSAATTLRAPGSTGIDRISAELLERAAAALNAAQRPVAPQPPSWECAPAGYNYRAMDSDGRWSWFKREPYAETLGEYDGWDDVEGIRAVRGHVFYPGWRDTLSVRPGAVVTVEAA